MGVCRPDAQILTLFQTPNYYFKTCNRPKLSHHYLDWNANKKNRNPFLIRMFLFLSYSFGTDMINSFLNSSRRSLENHTRFQTKMGKVYTRFKTETAQKPYPLGRHIPSMRASSPIWASLARTRLPLAASPLASLAQIGELARRLEHTYLTYIRECPPPLPPYGENLSPVEGSLAKPNYPGGANISSQNLANS